jgi:cyclophilin family peptidyl-prolyl cis-trans isomerase
MVFDAPEDQGLDETSKVEAVLSTSCGEIALELDPAIAPETVNSFVFLARAGYFDGTVSHRILPGFVLQAGDPSATGREGPGYTIPDELPGAGFLYEKGILAMANSGPNTSGSQFFVMLDDAPLPPNYSVFGRVIDGFDTLERIAQIPLGPNAFGEVSVPLETLYVERVTIADS